MHAQPDQRRFIHSIDRDGLITAVNQAWIDFARENDWPITNEAVLDRPLWGFIADPETRHLYHSLIERIRRHRSRVRLSYRCDSPGTRRFLDMEISIGGDGQRMDFSNQILRTERRRPVPMLDPAHRQRGDRLLLICSWCKLVQVSGPEWVEVEEAIRRLSLFDTNLPPQISHGICPPCAATLKESGYDR